MKRLIAIFLAAVLLFGTAGCTGQNPGTLPSTQTTVPIGSTGTQPPKIISVTLDVNMGSDRMTVVNLQEGACYGQLPEPQLQDWVFQGWFTDPVDGILVTPDMPLVSAQNHTLYAHWLPLLQYTVTFDPNGGTLPEDAATMAATIGQPYGELPVPNLDSYRFLGWFTELEGGELVESTTICNSKDHTLYAHWEFDIVAHWAYFLKERVSTIPESRRVVVYLEKTSNYKTFPTSDFLNDVGAINPARNLTNESVTDGWVRSAQPYIIVKLTADIYMGAVTKVAMQRRFPNVPIYIFPVSSVNGTEALQVYYRFQLAKILYPEYFEDVDLKAMAKEFGISPRIYY